MLTLEVSQFELSSSGLLERLSLNGCILSLSDEVFEVIAVIKLKSLILAQIERWRNALHMQVERQHGSLLLVASGERVSNTSEHA